MKRLGIFFWFVSLGLIIFVASMLYITSLPRPALERFVIEQEELNSAVFANRLAAEFLLKEDFTLPLTDEGKARFDSFVSRLQVPGLFRVKVWSPEGVIIYSDEEELIGKQFELAPHIISALNLKPKAELATLDASRDALKVYSPIAFGDSAEAVGVLETYAGVAFMNQQIDEITAEAAYSVIVSLALIFIVLSIIVWLLEKRSKKASKDLEKMNQARISQSEELSRLKDEFIFIAAHEMREPAALVSGNIEALEADPQFKSLPKSSQAPISDLKAASRRLQELVEDLLNIARIESGAIKMDIKPNKIKPIIGDAVKAIGFMAEKSGTTITVDDVAIANLPEVMIDKQRLKEVISNLLSNAVKYNRPGGKILVTAKDSEQMVAIIIQDTGIGMTSESLEKVFSKFFRANPEIEGTGLGLWIVGQLIEMMNGAVTVDSKPDKGSTFTVWLPLRPKS